MSRSGRRIVGWSGSLRLRQVFDADDAGLEKHHIRRHQQWGEWVNNLAAERGDIAMVFQNRAYPTYDMLQPIWASRSSCGARQRRDRQPRKRDADILSLWSLSERPRKLSGRPAPARRHGPRIVTDPQVFPVR